MTINEIPTGLSHKGFMIAQDLLGVIDYLQEQHYTGEELKQAFLKEAKQFKEVALQLHEVDGEQYDYVVARFFA